jgi:hypothetical protein
MMDQSEFEYVPVYTVCGQLAGEMVRMLLESVGIPAIVRQESAGVAIGVTVASLGLANVCVPENRVAEAMQVLQEMDEGQLENTPDLQEVQPPEDQNEQDED